VGQGSTFTVYVPIVAGDAAVADRRTGCRSEAMTGTETILVIEDSAPVRATACRALSQRGYQVLEARDSEEALAMSSSFPGTIDLVLSDVIIPGASGPDVVDRICRTGCCHPKVLFMSGHTDHAVLRELGLQGSIEFIQKPFVPGMLATNVREVLDVTTGERTNASLLSEAPPCEEGSASCTRC
jgi:DNA-binding response OmpR family regulator